MPNRLKSLQAAESDRERGGYCAAMSRLRKEQKIGGYHPRFPLRTSPLCTPGFFVRTDACIGSSAEPLSSGTVNFPMIRRADRTELNTYVGYRGANM